MSFLDDILFIQRRRVALAAIGLLFLAFFGRLIQLQVLYYEELGKKSEENSIRTIPREPIRGYLYDRFGRLAVDNHPAFTVTVMPFEFNKARVGDLARLLELDTAFISDRIRKGEAHSRFIPVKIKRDIDFPTLSLLEENHDRLPGVAVQSESKRAYVTGARASHILGYLKEVTEQQLRFLGPDYVPGDVVGSSGLEARYETQLRGTKGQELSLVNVRGQIVGSLDNGAHDVPPADGQDLVLTMDFGVQALAESLLAGRHGALVAMDPRTGGIIAMVSAPDFDPRFFSGVTTADLWREMNADPAVPLYNRATLTRYPPGSTFKMILAIAALENDIVSPSWRISCTGAYRFGNRTFKDLHVHGSTDMYRAIQASCNVYFYQLMLKTGLDRWSAIGEEFGFGRITGADIAEENPGLLPSTAFMNRRYGPRGWTKGFTISMAIGQGELGVTPLQMAAYASTLANEGTYYRPHAVLGARDRATGAIDTLRTEHRTVRLRPSTWEVVREGMRRVVMETGGTGGMARIPGVEVAGKTGTSENPHGPDHAWFIGFAPFDDPAIAIAVIVENVGYGGTFSAPIAGKCMERYLRDAGILPPPAPPKEARPAPAPPPIAAQGGE